MCRQSVACTGQQITLVCSVAGAVGPTLFIYNNSAACYWYNTVTDRQDSLVELYITAGWLAGQTIHNRACLGIKLAPVLWRKILEGDNFQASSIPEAVIATLRSLFSRLPQLGLCIQICSILTQNKF